MEMITVVRYKNIDDNPLVKKIKKELQEEPQFETVPVMSLNNPSLKGQETVYSDRLYQWDSKKYDAACELVWGNHGQYFTNRSEADIEKFLSLYFDKEVTLVYIEIQTSGWTGHTVWRFDFVEK